jgi:hypothetical protein
MMLEITPGSVAVPTANNTGTVLCHSDAVETLTLDPAPPSGQDRQDLVICQARGADLDGGTDNDFIFAFVTGVPYSSGTYDPSRIPATPPGAVALAQVGLVGGTATVVGMPITDLRPGALGVPSAAGRLYPFSQTVFQPGVPSELTLDAIDYLSGGFAHQGNTLVVPVKGIYHFNAALLLASSNTPPQAMGHSWLNLLRNGANVAQLPGFADSAGWANAVHGAADLALNAGDAVAMQFYFGGSGAVGTYYGNGAKENSWLAAHLITAM